MTSTSTVIEPASVFRYAQKFDIVEGEDGGIIDVPQIGAYRAQNPIPAHVFEAQRLQALAPDTPSGFIDLDLSPVLGTSYPATLPLLLCRYLRVRAGESFGHTLRASGEIYYVIRGQGRSQSRGKSIAWKTGDVFVFPGGALSVHQADDDALLFLATDEPQLNYLQVNAPAPQDSPVLAAHFSAARITERLDTIHQKNEPHMGPGKATTFYTRPMLHTRAMLPMMNVGMNSLEPGGQQRPHQHSAAAITLAIQNEGVYSRVNGERVDWPEFGVFVTPPDAPHSHHNDGTRE
ncbi:MAG: hypothetical protein Q8K31_02280, partial [Burkholderiaceae bacterium]|nr:hypothetical protein [Burkholderiaceae bacterium]